ncbi:uncharacterized protein LOC131928149 [Physella acuta]|uniref:uncharacterized protein LOC131928149 n=1 Tax=Physella acuta TaxID=109671 RepID=UPI0027DBC8FC|nr:uncharacterized protein LOC131928149 [Physella acuta]
MCLPWLVLNMDGKVLALVAGVVFRLFAADVGVLAWGVVRGHRHILHRGLRMKPLLEPSMSWLSAAGYNIRYGVVIAAVVASTLTLALNSYRRMVDPRVVKVLEAGTAEESVVKQDGVKPDETVPTRVPGLKKPEVSIKPHPLAIKELPDGEQKLPYPDPCYDPRRMTHEDGGYDLRKIPLENGNYNLRTVQMENDGYDLRKMSYVDSGYDVRKKPYVDNGYDVRMSVPYDYDETRQDGGEMTHHVVQGEGGNYPRYTDVADHDVMYQRYPEQPCTLKLRDLDIALGGLGVYDGNTRYTEEGKFSLKDVPLCRGYNSPVRYPSNGARLKDGELYTGQGQGQGFIGQPRYPEGSESYDREDDDLRYAADNTCDWNEMNGDGRSGLDRTTGRWDKDPYGPRRDQDKDPYGPRRDQDKDPYGPRRDQVYSNSRGRDEPRATEMSPGQRRYTDVHRQEGAPNFYTPARKSNHDLEGVAEQAMAGGGQDKRRSRDQCGDGAAGRNTGIREKKNLATLEDTMRTLTSLRDSLRE